MSQHSQFYQPTKEPASQLNLATKEPASQFCLATKEPASQFYLTTKEPASQFYQPTKEPASQFYQPTKEPASQFYLATKELASQFYLAIPANLRTSQPILPRNQRTIQSILPANQRASQSTFIQEKNWLILEILVTYTQWQSQTRTNTPRVNEFTATLKVSMLHTRLVCVVGMHLNIGNKDFILFEVWGLGFDPHGTAAIFVYHPCHWTPYLQHKRFLKFLQTLHLKIHKLWRPFFLLQNSKTKFATSLTFSPLFHHIWYETCAQISLHRLYVKVWPFHDYNWYQLKHETNQSKSGNHK